MAREAGLIFGVRALACYEKRTLMIPGVRHGMGWFATAVLAMAACTRGSAVGGAPPSENTPPLSQSLRPPEAPEPAPLPVGEWADAVRHHRWRDAQKLLDQLPAKDTARADIKYVRARVAVELGEHARAVQLLDKLELPQLKDDVAELRASAQLEAGPFEPAARHFARSTDPERLTRAAIGFERAKLYKEARIAADRAVVASGLDRAKKKKKRNTSNESAARAVRARVYQALEEKELAAADLRWLATFAPTSEAAKGVDEKIAALSPKRALDKRERYTRALELADAGRVADVERELGLIDGANGAEVSQAERLHARGWALYTARDYEKAAEVLEQSGKLGGTHAAHDAYYAARARSRAQQDERAIQMYGEVAQRFRNSQFAENARFRSARLFYVMGRWKDAARSYATYLSKHKKDGRFIEQARFEQAIAWLAGGEPARAQKSLAALADAEKSEHESAALGQLAALAHAKAGKKEAAIAGFRRVIAERPLSFPALVAMARLSELGAPLPPLIEPGKAGQRAHLAVELPPKARLLHGLGLDADAERDIADREDTIRHKHAPRGDEALCRLYGELSEAGRRYRVGQRAARWSELDRAPADDNRWLWDCVYPRPYEPLVRAQESAQTLPVDLIYAVMRQESGFSPVVVSPANAVGLLQLIPPTAANVARELSLDYDPLLLSSPDYNIKLGAHYLSKVLATFGGNVALAAAAYNAGPRAVSRWLEKGEDLPLDIWVARIPYDETRNYVMRVIGNHARYAYLSGGDAAVPKIALELPKGLRAAGDAY